MQNFRKVLNTKASIIIIICIFLLDMPVVRDGVPQKPGHQNNSILRIPIFEPSYDRVKHILARRGRNPTVEQIKALSSFIGPKALDKDPEVAKHVLNIMIANWDKSQIFMKHISSEAFNIALANYGWGLRYMLRIIFTKWDNYLALINDIDAASFDEAIKTDPGCVSMVSDIVNNLEKYQSFLAQIGPEKFKQAVQNNPSGVLKTIYTAIKNWDMCMYFIGKIGSEAFAQALVNDAASVADTIGVISNRKVYYRELMEKPGMVEAFKKAFVNDTWQIPDTLEKIFSEWHKNGPVITAENFPKMLLSVTVYGQYLPEYEILERVGCAFRRNNHGGPEFDVLESFVRITHNLDFLSFIKKSDALEKLIRRFFKYYHTIIRKRLEHNMVEISILSRNSQLTTGKITYSIIILKQAIKMFKYYAKQIEALQSNEDITELKDRLRDLLSDIQSVTEKLQSQYELISAQKSQEFHPVVRLIQEWYANIPGVSIESLVPPDMLVEINGISFKSALNNIINNALFFAKKRQKETGIPADVKIVLKEANGKLLIEISDNGEGILPKALDFNQETQRQYIFDINYSLRPGGTGLGLTEAFYVLKDADGTIKAESPGKLGIGTTFTITLPIYQSPERTTNIFPAVRATESSI